MTRDEILAMPAGRGMDVCISEMFFKRKCHQDFLGIWIEDVAEHAHVLPRYSETYQGAMQIIGSPDVKELYFEKKSDEYFCMIGDNFDTATKEKTFPLAISRAALLAIMEDE